VQVRSYRIGLFFYLIGAVLFFSGCTPAAAVVIEARPTKQATLQPDPTLTATAELLRSTDAVLSTPTLGGSTTQAPVTTATQPAERLSPDRWKDWPVVPEISNRAVQIYQDGVSQGNNPRAFSKIGDCETITEWFLADFDRGSGHYVLGPYSQLQTVIDTYSGSYGRLGVAAKRGFTAASVLNTYWRDADLCNKNETPLDCEIRLNKPAFALIMLGTNDVARPERFEKNLRAVIDETIRLGVLPVLMTKADNLEGDNSLNLTTARLAYEYDIPLWNFWKAVQTLPSKGLQQDQSHLTFAPNDFSDPENMKRAWPVRNLTALEVLDAIRQAVEPLP
jgi:hypothetical protein